MLSTPVLPVTVQLLPLTLIHEVAAEETIPVPSRWFPEIVPPVVPSLMSMFSAVVFETSLPVMTSWSLASGWQLLYLHQFLCAVPT